MRGGFWVLVVEWGWVVGFLWWVAGMGWFWFWFWFWIVFGFGFGGLGLRVGGCGLVGWLVGGIPVALDADCLIYIMYR